MKREDYEEWKRESEAAVREPRVGDVFMDHFTRICRVAARDGDQLKISKPVPHGPDHYVWGDPQPMSMHEFRRWLSYHTQPGVWCEVAMPRPGSTVKAPHSDG